MVKSSNVAGYGNSEEWLHGNDIEHGVPRTTLKDRLSGRVIHGTNIGPKPYLTQEEEKQLVQFLVNCCKMGYGKTRGEVLKIVEAIMKKKGKENMKAAYLRGGGVDFATDGLHHVLIQVLLVLP